MGGKRAEALIFAKDIFLNFLRTLLKFVLLLCASVPAASLGALLLSIYMGGHIDADAFYFSVSTGLIGHIYAAPGLFMFYFPWSIMAWRNSKKELWQFLLAGASFGIMNGMLFCGIFRNRSDFGHFEDGYKSSIVFLLLFTGASFLTALLHWHILSAVQRRKPELLK